MATSTKTKKSKDLIEAEERATSAELQTQKLEREIKLFITGVDELFKSKPTNQEMGQTLALMIQSLERSIDDRG
jgi:hypothetical protein